MTQLAGLVFDPYDDPEGNTLREIIPDPSDIPPFVKEAHRITSEQASQLPDDNYALVLLKEGQKLKKYATVDAGNTVLSVMYLLKQAHLLPEKAVKIAATNLLEACQRFQLEAPEQLKVAARTGVSGVSGLSQDPYLRKQLNKSLERVTDYPTPEPQKESLPHPQLGVRESDEDLKSRTNTKGVSGTNFLETPPFSTKERFSNAEGAAVEKMASTEVVQRERMWRVSPYVDLTGWQPGATLQKEASVPQRTLLRGKYPVDSYSQVKTAEAYFEQYQRQFHPRDRKVYCTKLAARMEELGLPVGGDIEKYASDTYGADVEAYVSYRRGFVPEDFHPSLDLLLEKRAQVSPETFAESLCEFDQLTNLHYRWDSQIPDPWRSTYGPSWEKIAEAEWTWDEHGVRIHASHLENLATNGHTLLAKSFGEDFAKEFSKSPKTFFEALPLPQKKVVGRMAMDHDAGTGTE